MHIERSRAFNTNNYPCPPLHLLLRGTRLARVVMTRLYTWGRPALIEVGAELLTQIHLLTVNLRDRYVSLLLILALLIFSSASARLPHFANEFHDALNRRDFACFRDLAGVRRPAYGGDSSPSFGCFLVGESGKLVLFLFFWLGVLADCALAYSGSLCIRGGHRV